MKNLYQKICDVMLEVQSVEKGATISMGGGSYSAVSHDDVTRLLHLPVARAGIVLSPSVIENLIERQEYKDNYGKDKIQYKASVLVELIAINADNPDERLSVKMPSIAFDAGDKCFGKAISMATKYAYLKLFMLESVDEEESRPDSQYNDRRNQPPVNNYSSKSPPRETIKQGIKEVQKTINQDATQKAKDDLAKIQANKAAQDKKDDKELEKRVDDEIKQEIGSMLKILMTDLKTIQEKGEFMFKSIGINKWGEIEKMKNHELLEIESKLLTIFKTR